MQEAIEENLEQTVENGDENKGENHRTGSDASKNSCSTDGDEQTIERMVEKIEALEKKCEELLEKNVGLKTQNSKLQKDNRILKKMLESSKNLNLCKDVKIQKLTAASATTTSNGVSNNVNQTKSNTKQVLFADHEQHFSSIQLNKLRSIEKGKRRDSAFISKCLEFLYDGNTEIIAGKHSGNRKLEGKSMVSPAKKVLMEQLLNERVESEGIDGGDFLERSSRLNRLIGDGIYTLTKRRAPADMNHQTPKTVTQSTTQIQLNPMVNTLQPVFHTSQMFDAFNFVTLPY